VDLRPRRGRRRLRRLLQLAVVVAVTAVTIVFGVPVAAGEEEHPPANTQTPTISGTARDGETLTADPGTWSGTEPVDYSYQWQRCDASGAGCADLDGATQRDYTLRGADVGSTLRVKVTASNTAGSSTADSDPSAEVAAVAPANTQPPTVSGTARDGETLTADPGAWSGTEPIEYAYQWRRCTASGTPCVDAGGPTSARTYTLGPSDVGSTIRVYVTASNSVGETEAKSAETTAVAAVRSQAGAPVIAATGDTACDPTSSSFKSGLGTSNYCRQKYTSDLLVNDPPSKVLALGDNQYNCAGYDAFLRSYDLSWGRQKSITRPVLGDEEYAPSGGTDCDATGQAGGHFQYWGSAAGDPGKGYYSYDVGDWHVIALNSNCSKVSCSATSPQVQWLKADLAANPRSCTLAYFHYPRFYSGGSMGSLATMWNELRAAGTDVLLTGHRHHYERLAPLDNAGNYDPVKGMRQFIVGTGGKSHQPLSSTIRPTSEARNDTTNGVLKLTLGSTGYDWAFTPESDQGYTDTGSGSCNRDTTPPSTPANLTATATESRKVDLNWMASSDDAGVTGYEVYRDGQLLTTTGSTATSYSDTTVTPGSTHSYEVRARDAAGNRSAPSNSATVATPAETLTFKAQSDARVQESSPSSKYGTSTYLRTDGGSDPDTESLLRFSVSGVRGTVTGAKLRMRVKAGSTNGPAAFANAGGWTESGVSWNTRPARVGSAMDDKGAVSTGTWAEFDVKPRVTGDGTYDFTLATTSTDGADFDSREVAGAEPQLVVSYR